MKAKAGLTNYLATVAWADVEKVVLHEGYDSQTQENDIALVKLTSAPPATGRANGGVLLRWTN